MTCEQYLNRFDKLVEFSKKESSESVKIDTIVRKQLSETGKTLFYNYHCLERHSKYSE